MAPSVPQPKNCIVAKQMRIVMMGTGPYAAPTLARLDQSPHQVLALVTRPEQAVRGQRTFATNPMRQLAVAQAIPVLDPEDVNSETAQTALRNLNPDLLVVCDYGQLLAPETLSVAKHGGFNLHASLLPRYRGAAPIQWAIYHGETQTGNTVIHMSAALDAGPIVARQVAQIGAEETAIELEARLARSGATLVLEAIAAEEAGTLTALPQEHAAATRAPKMKKDDGQIDWNRRAEEIVNQVRALVPWPKTYTHWFPDTKNPLRMIVEKVAVESGERPARPGEVVEAAGDRLLVGTGEGLLRVEQLQPAGKKSLPASAFLRGYRISVGESFGMSKRQAE